MIWFLSYYSVYIQMHNGTLNVMKGMHLKRCYRVLTGHGKSGKSWNFTSAFSRPWKSCCKSLKVIIYENKSVLNVSFDPENAKNSTWFFWRSHEMLAVTVMESHGIMEGRSVFADECRNRHDSVTFPVQPSIVFTQGRIPRKWILKWICWTFWSDIIPILCNISVYNCFNLNGM